MADCLGLALPKLQMLSGKGRSEHVRPKSPGWYYFVPPAHKAGSRAGFSRLLQFPTLHWDLMHQDINPGNSLSENRK